MAAGDEHDIGASSTLYALGDQAPTALDDTIAADTAAAALPADGPVELAGRSEARYTYRGRLGQGGMGQVDWVWDADLMRDLAVKRLREELRREPGLLRRFLWQARVTASLDHTNIVPVHDIGMTPDGDVYFTMKRAAGESLAQVIRKLADGDDETAAQLPMPRRLRMFLQVCQAIEFAHSRGIIHRDLKPDNIMLGSHGETLVMDWGLAVIASLMGHRTPACLHLTDPATRLAAVRPAGRRRWSSLAKPRQLRAASPGTRRVVAPLRVGQRTSSAATRLRAPPRRQRPAFARRLPAARTAGDGTVPDRRRSPGDDARRRLRPK